MSNSAVALGRSATTIEKPGKENKVTELADTKMMERSATTKEKKPKQVDDDIKDLNIAAKDDDEVAGAGGQKQKSKKTKGNPKHRIVMNEEERK